MVDAHDVARIQAARESGLPEEHFPEACPYQFQPLMATDWMPA